MNNADSFQYLMKGGFMMIPLLISALVALTAVIERLYVLHVRLKESRTLCDEVLASLKSTADLSMARQRLKKANAPIASVLEAGLRDEGAPVEEIELSMQAQAEMWVPVLERRLDILDTVITAAPLMGLLGTITGMMSSFQVLSEKGVGEPHAITGGVAEALIATATGLVIALLCLLAYNYFNHVVRDVIFSMENAGARLLEVRKIIARKSS